MSIRRSGIFSVCATSCASFKLAALDVAYGGAKPYTFSAPSARAHKNAVPAESTPPEIPITAREMPRRSTISSRRNAVSHVAVRPASIGGGAGAGNGALTIGSIAGASGQRQFVVEEQIRQHRLQIAQQRQTRACQIDFGQIQ